MNDPIYRQVAIDAVRQHKTNVLGEREWDAGIQYGYEAAHEHICEVLAGLPSAQQWIPCSERLPYAEYGESPNVYCYCYDPDLGGKWAQLLYYDGGVWCLPTGETFEYRVLAWYPLPTKPYKEDSDG